MATEFNLALPKLEENNYIIWKYAVEAYAAEYDILNYITTAVPEPSPEDGEELVSTHKKKMAQTRRLLTSTISPDIVLQLGEAVLAEAPHKLLEAIHEFFKANESADYHEQLLQRARQLTIQNDEDVDEYIKRHLRLRQEMIRSKYPHIANEQTTVTFIIRGLAPRRALATHIPLLLENRTTTIRDFKTVLALVTSTVDNTADVPMSVANKWCEYHQRFGNHTTMECWGLQRERRRIPKYQHIQPRQDDGNQYWQSRRGAQRGILAGAPRGRGRSHYRGRACGRAAPVQQREAYAAYDTRSTEGHLMYDTDPGKYEETMESNGNQDKINHDDAFLYYTVDSACNPSFCTTQVPGQRLTQADVVLPDGTKAQVRASGPATLMTRDGREIKLADLCQVPAFTKNLLSVHELTAKNNCQLLLKQNGGYIIQSDYCPHPSEIIANVDKHKGGYRIALRNTSSAPITANGVSSQKSIESYFRKRKSLNTVPPGNTKQKQSQQDKPTARGTRIAELHEQTPRFVTEALQPPSQVRGQRSDRVTHTVPFPDHLPEIPPQQRQKLDTAHSWHLRLNHVNAGTVQDMAKLPYDLGLPAVLGSGIPVMHCQGCSVGHMQKAAHRGKTPRPPPGHTVVTDIAGPLPTTGESHTYFMTVTELHTRMKLVFLLKNRSETEAHISEAIAKIERHFGHPIARIRCDNANEYLTKALIKLFGQRAIGLDPTTPHTPEENSVAERLNRTLMARMRATLHASKMPFDKYWGFCLLDTVTKTNSTLQSTINDIPRRLWQKHQSPYTPLTAGSIKVDKFRMFGEYGFIPNLKSTKKKAEARGILVRYLYTIGDHHYKVISPHTGQLLICRIVNFRPYNPNFDPIRLYNQTIPSIEQRNPRVNLHHAIPYYAHNAGKQALEGSADEPTAHRIPQPTSTDFTDLYACMVEDLIQTDPPPRSISQARNSHECDQWEDAYEHESQMHEDFGTFQYINAEDVPSDAYIAKPVFTLRYKRNSNGQVSSYKIRASYPGNRLTPGIHFDPDTVAAYAADRDSVRLMLAIAAQQNLTPYHVDLVSAFLHEDYTGPTPLYMEPLPNFDGTARHPGKVARIVKNIYGTPNAPKIYTEGLKKHLLKFGYTQLKADRNLYVRRRGTELLIMAVTIDDFSVATNSKLLYAELLQNLDAKYRVKDLGEARHMLGWTITRDPQTGAIHISQPQLCEAYIRLLRMQGALGSDTPYHSIPLNGAKPGEEIIDASQYPFSSAVGILRYLVDSTRPELAFITGTLARNLTKPTMRHWKAAKHIARYLITTKHYGILYRAGQPELTAHSDADFAGCRDTRQSTYGTVVYYAGSPVSWCSRRIKSVVTSTCAAEYIAASNTALQIQWLRQLLQEILPYELPPTVLTMDNRSAIAVANATAPTKKSKYIEVRYHHLQDKIQHGEIETTHTPSALLTADIMTKPLPAVTFHRHRDSLQVCPPLRTDPRL